jgi:hypothetical protein
LKMAIASSGAIKLNAHIGGELGVTAGAATALEDASRGTYSTINTNNDAADRPDGDTPHAMSEFYSYDHSAAAPGYGGIFIDDFIGNPMNIRTTFDNTALGDGQSFPTDGDGNTVTGRPVWTYNNGGSGTSHEGNDTIRVSNANTHPQWRTTNVPTHSNFSGTIVIECRFYTTGNSNKDIVFAWDCISQGDYWSSSNLDEGYFFQFDDSSSKWIKARRRNSSSATTLGTSSNNAFADDTWFTAKFTWNQSTGAIKVYVDGSLKLSVTDTSYDDFCPSGGGIRFMASRYMTNSVTAYNEMDWIKVYKE